jgi:hypothetical protein
MLGSGLATKERKRETEPGQLRNGKPDAHWLTARIARGALEIHVTMGGCGAFGVGVHDDVGRWVGRADAFFGGDDNLVGVIQAELGIKIGVKLDVHIGPARARAHVLDRQDTFI